ncbi:MAG: hypothetical protein MUD01_20340 [Chloroflexaceae bacterium]|jgi:hypothetical protein|nr:hypothetical protein [Chloroflexaceae bacterium]
MDSKTLIHWVEQEMRSMLEVPVGDAKLFSMSNMFFEELVHELAQLPPDEYNKVRNTLLSWSSSQMLSRFTSRQDKYTEDTLEGLIATLDGILEDEGQRRITISTPPYQLRITKTQQRHNNQQLYLVERVVHGSVKDFWLENRDKVLARMSAARVPVHTKIQTFIKHCHDHHIPVHSSTD